MSAPNGKIIIKKKSGPGELTGITEMDLSQYGDYDASIASFKELQFTEAGDYILTISCTNDMIDYKEINVKVLQPDKIIAQSDISNSVPKKELPIDGSRPIIAQIDQPTIKVDQIKMKTDGTNDQKEYVSGIGFTPFVWYNGYQIEDRYIKSLSLYHEGIIPKIRLSFQDSKGIMKDIGSPRDNTSMELFLNSTSKNIKSIHFKFKIEEFLQGKNVPGQVHTIVGTMDIPNLYVISNKSYNDTSFNVIRQMCKELGIGFNSNISNTVDKMPWKNANRKPYEFIEDIIQHSYITDESFMVGYIDFYYNFNYVDVEKEMNRDISKDVGIDTSASSSQQITDESKRINNLVLSNDKSYSSTSFYIDSFTIRNDSTKKSLKEGYSTTTKSYDRIKKEFLIFNVDYTTSDGGNNIILKSNAGDPDFYENNIKTIFTGKLDGDNTHSNYNYAKTQNAINLASLNKVCIIVNLPNANFNLYKFQKVNVNIINDVNTLTEKSIINSRYSGEYIIADIEYNWRGGKMSQKVRLIRKELGKTPTEIQTDPPMANRVETKTINDNPIIGVTSSNPNNVYQVGETYLVQDRNNELYNLTIKKISDNGIEILGTVTKTQRNNKQNGG